MPITFPSPSSVTKSLHSKSLTTDSADVPDCHSTPINWTHSTCHPANSAGKKTRPHHLASHRPASRPRTPTQPQQPPLRRPQMARRMGLNAGDHPQTNATVIAGSPCTTIRKLAQATQVIARKAQLEAIGRSLASRIGDRLAHLSYLRRSGRPTRAGDRCFAASVDVTDAHCR